MRRAGQADADMIIDEVRQYLHASPFEPFQVVTSSGHRYRVATADHAGINPLGNRMVIWFDDEGSVTISGLHIVAIEKEGTAKKGA